MSSGAYLGRGQWGQLSPPREKEKEKRRREGEEMAAFFEFVPTKKNPSYAPDVI